MFTSRIGKIILGLVLSAVVVGVLFALYTRNDEAAARHPDGVATDTQAREGRGEAVAPAQDRLKAAALACLSSIRTAEEDAGIVLEGSELVKRTGAGYLLRVRTLKNDKSGSFLRTTYVCEAVEAAGTWSVLRAEIPG